MPYGATVSASGPPATPPPSSTYRIALDPQEGRKAFTLQTVPVREPAPKPFLDGTTHVVFEPLDFIARLAALVPAP